jgi:outer membrane lipoprotein carrier protein
VAVALLLAPVPGSPRPLAAQDPGAIVGRAARVYRSLASLRADFVQVIDDKMIGKYDAKGVLIQAGDNKLSMRFTEPAGDMIIADGQQVWVYTPSTTPGQVLRLPIPADPVYGFNFLAWVLDRPAERYQMSYVRADTVEGRAVDVIEMVPLQPELPFRRAVVSLDREDALPRHLEIEEKSGATRLLTLSRLKLNQSFPDRTFRFDVPSGVRIIDQR